MNEQSLLTSLDPRRLLWSSLGRRSSCPAHAGSSVWQRVGLLALALWMGLSSAACATVRPEQRAVLADPTMVPQSEALEAEARDHVFDNREGSFGGGSVQGGGCGCN